MKECLCGNKDKFSLIHRGVRGGDDKSVLKCECCGLMQLDTFIVDSLEFYSNSLMRQYAPVQKDLYSERAVTVNDDVRRYEYIKDIIENKTWIDVGCGAGGVIHKSKYKAKKAYGVEPEAQMRDALIKEGIECFASIQDAKEKLKEKVDVLSMFHVLEHIENPIEFLNDAKSIVCDGGRIIIEVPNADDALLSVYECEAYADFTYWECHYYYFTVATLKNVAEKAGLKNSFIQCVQRYPLANHLYWLTKGLPGGHGIWNALKDPILDKAYGDKLSQLGCADTIIAEFIV